MITFLEALEAAHEAATPGPWRRADPPRRDEDAWGHDPTNDIMGPVPEGKEWPKEVITSFGFDADGVEASPEDLRLICLLRNAAPELIALLEAAREVDTMDVDSWGDEEMLEDPIRILRESLSALDATVPQDPQEVAK